MALLNIFRRSDYTSDTTQFIDQLRPKSLRWRPSSAPGAPCWGTRTWTGPSRPNTARPACPQQPYVYGTSSHPNGK